MHSFTSNIWKENSFLFLLSILIYVEDVNSAKSFKNTLNLNGTVMCALDQPSQVIPFDQLPPSPSGSCSPVRCAWQCTLDPDCTNFNYREDERRCELFHYTPSNCSILQECNHLQVNGLKSCHVEGQQTTTRPTCMSIVDTNDCSLPFQYKYQEYIGCINVIGIDTPQCVTLNGTLMNCSYPSGYTAKQDVVNMTMGTLSGPLPCISNWIIMMNRFNGSVSFNRSWTEYKMGFGDIRTSEFWIGNENIHLYTNQPGASYRLRVEFQGNTTGKWFFAEYATFSVDSEASKYAIHLSGFVGNGGDSLTNTSVSSAWNHNGMKFSTSKVDNDLWTDINCASHYSTGWWFNSCWYACLTCIYGTADFSWYTLHDFQYERYGVLRAARMMIRSN